MMLGVRDMPERTDPRRVILTDELRDPDIRRKHEANVKGVARRIVARFARGNARLQKGAYFTKKDIEEELTHLPELPSAPSKKI